MASSFVITLQLESLGTFEKPRIRFSVETWYRRHQVNSSITKGGMILFGGEEGSEKIVQTKRFFAQENKQDIFSYKSAAWDNFFPILENFSLGVLFAGFFPLNCSLHDIYFFPSPSGCKNCFSKSSNIPLPPEKSNDLPLGMTCTVFD